MSEIVKREYVNEDFDRIFQFMIGTYTRDWKNGVPAPFLEHAQKFPWTDRAHNHRNAVWEEDGEIVAFCFFESSLGSAFFNVKEGYDKVVPDMLVHAERNLCDNAGNLELKVFGAQKNVIKQAQKFGYRKVGEYAECIYDYADGALNHNLPEGFFFENPEDIDMEKAYDATWQGFENKTERPANNFRPTTKGAVKGMDVVVKDEDGDYVCCAGMYMVPENHLAYMEPLATIKEYRNKGIAAAALSEMYRRTIKLGATHMTGGGNKFYYDLGFRPIVEWTMWQK